MAALLLDVVCLFLCSTFFLALLCQTSRGRGAAIPLLCTWWAGMSAGKGRVWDRGAVYSKFRLDPRAQGPAPQTTCVAGRMDLTQGQCYASAVTALRSSGWPLCQTCFNCLHAGEV